MVAVPQQPERYCAPLGSNPRVNHLTHNAALPPSASPRAPKMKAEQTGPPEITTVGTTELLVLCGCGFTWKTLELKKSSDPPTLLKFTSDL